MRLGRLAGWEGTMGNPSPNNSRVWRFKNQNDTHSKRRAHGSKQEMAKSYFHSVQRYCYAGTCRNPEKRVISEEDGRTEWGIKTQKMCKGVGNPPKIPAARRREPAKSRVCFKTQPAPQKRGLRIRPCSPPVPGSQSGTPPEPIREVLSFKGS